MRLAQLVDSMLIAAAKIPLRSGHPVKHDPIVLGVQGDRLIPFHVPGIDQPIMSRIENINFTIRGRGVCQAVIAFGDHDGGGGNIVRALAGATANEDKERTEPENCGTVSRIVHRSATDLEVAIRYSDAQVQIEQSGEVLLLLNVLYEAIAVP